MSLKSFKSILCLIPFLLLSACGTVTQAPQFTKVSLAPVQTEVTTAKTHVQKAQAIVKQIEQKLPPEQLKLIADERDALLKELNDTQDALSRAEGAVSAKQTEVDTQTANANKVSQQLNTILPKYQAVEHKYHRDKMMLSVILALLVGVVVMKFSYLIPPPYNFVAIGAVPAIAAIISYLVLTFVVITPTLDPGGMSDECPMCEEVHHA